MKRWISLALSFVLLVTALMPISALADGTLLQTYNSIVIQITPYEDLDTEFREFVKEVASEYYWGTYNLNKYYYDAAKVKHEWDNGGAFYSRRNNPYSTYEDYKDYDKYNIPVIQSMLIDGIQEKADTIRSIDIQDYSLGMAVDPQTGDWVVHEKAVLAQETYNAEVEYGIEQAQNTLTGTLINSAVDLAVVAVTQGKTPEALANVLDAMTNVLADAMNAFAEAEYTNLQATLQNSYYDLMAQSVLDMYENIEEQLLEDYRQLYSELNRKSSRTNDEQNLMEQLRILLNAIDSMSSPSLTAKDKQCITAVAEELVNSVGLEKVPALSDEEYTALVVSQIAKSTLINCLDLIAKTAIGGVTDANTPFLKELGLTSMKDLILNQVDGIWETVTNVEIVDQNGDGVYDVGEIIYNALSMLIDQNLFRDAATAVFTVLKEKSVIKSLDAEVAAAEKAFSDANGAYNKSLSRPSKNYGKNVQLKKDMETARGNREQVKKANNKLKEEIELNKLTGIGILIEDVVNIVCDTFNLASESVGLGDMADNEVYFAYLACSMYHIMKNAETRRSTLLNEYGHLRYASEIDQEDVAVLKKLVNRIYAVYEMDMLGHAYYTTLDMGWWYQTTQQMQDAMAEFDALQDRMHQKYGTIGQYALNVGGGWVVYLTYAWVGGQDSEYLKKVNKDGTYKWLSYDRALEVYSEIADYAAGAQIPQRFQKIGK